MSYRGFKRLLGESGLELKTRILLGASVVLLMSASFCFYARQTEELAYDQTPTHRPSSTCAPNPRPSPHEERIPESVRRVPRSPRARPARHVEGVFSFDYSPWSQRNPNSKTWERMAES